MTRLQGSLRRELDIKGQPHVVTLTPEGFKLTEKGRRIGLEISWDDLVSGDAAMAAALNASLEAGARSSRKRKAGTEVKSDQATAAGRQRKREAPAPARPRRSRAVRKVIE
jgi:hypothetical protein